VHLYTVSRNLHLIYTSNFSFLHHRAAYITLTTLPLSYGNAAYPFSLHLLPTNHTQPTTYRRPCPEPYGWRNRRNMPPRLDIHIAKVIPHFRHRAKHRRFARTPDLHADTTISIRPCVRRSIGERPSIRARCASRSNCI
jgi:hypothetical protein